jgi:hypothetical protein
VQVLRSAGRSLGRLALALGLLGLIGGLSLLVAFPLWYFCARWPRAFTAAIGGLLAAGLAYLLVRRLRRASLRAGGFRLWWRRRFLPGLRTAGLVLASLGAAYGIALAAARIFR